MLYFLHDHNLGIFAFVYDFMSAHLHGFNQFRDTLDAL